MSHVHHTFQPVWEDPWRCTRTRESQVEIQMFCSSLFQRKRESSLSTEKSAMSLNCEPIMPFEEKNSSIETLWSGISHEIASWRTKESYTVLSTIRVEFAGIEGRKRRRGSPWIRPTASFSTHGTPDHSRRERESLALHRIEGRRKSSTRESRMSNIQRKWNNWKSFAVQKLKERNRWEQMNFLGKNGKVNLLWISLRFKFRNYKIKWTLWTTPESSMILWVIPRSQLSYECSESSWNAQSRFLLAAWHTELTWYIGKRFLKIYLHRMNSSSFRNCKKSCRYT